VNSANENGLLGAPLGVASAGVELFANELELQGATVARVNWRPPVQSGGSALNRLALRAEEIASANDAAVDRLNSARPMLVGVGTARNLIADMGERTFLHAGPPIDWSSMSGPLRGAIIGGALHEGLATNHADAERRAARGDFEFVPCHERAAVGPMAGVVTASMPMLVVENTEHANRAFCSFNEGLGKVLRYGANDTAVLDRLAWMRDVLARIFARALERLDAPIDLRAMTAQALQMGDEGHNRNRAGTSLLLRELLPGMIGLEEPLGDVVDVARFIAGNDHFYLNLTMPMAKAAADAAAGIAGSSIVVAMARNGTEFGVRLSGTGNRWFTGPSGMIDGLYMPGYGSEDANPDIGDSTITETVGLGGFAMAAAPAIVRFVGGDPEDAVRATESMYGITWAESRHFHVPALGFRGTPLGIDSREVVHTAVLPVVNTGIAHREPGIGQIGAGLVEPPMSAFVDAVRYLADSAHDEGRL
jgi:hypothetical protein